MIGFEGKAWCEFQMRNGRVCGLRATMQTLDGESHYCRRHKLNVSKKLKPIVKDRKRFGNYKL